MIISGSIFSCEPGQPYHLARRWWWLSVLAKFRSQR